MTWWSPQTGVIAVAILVAVAVAVSAWRSRPAGKVELAIVPTSNFDPSMEDIVRYASHLVRTRRLRDSLSSAPRPVRISLKSVGEGQLVQTVTVDESAAAMLRRHGLAGVELISMAELDRRLAGVAGSDSSQPDQDRPDDPAVDSPPDDVSPDAAGPEAVSDGDVPVDPPTTMGDQPVVEVGPAAEPVWPAGPDDPEGRPWWPSLQGDTDG